MTDSEVSESGDATVSRDNEQSPPSDIVTIAPSDYNRMILNTPLIGGEITSSREDIECGIEVHQDGQNIAVKAGTTWTAEDQPEFYTYHGISLDEARQIRDGLDEAIENVKNGAEPRYEPESKSLVDRLVEMVK